MNIQGKIWGQTSSLFDKNNVEIHRIECNKNGFCSKHKHISKYNMFFIEKGKLEISVWKNDYNLIDKTIISFQQTCIVRPQEYHLFKCLEDNTVAFEIYWVEIDKNDIERESIGGIDEDNSL
jgi:hypothetical protein